MIKNKRLILFLITLTLLIFFSHFAAADDSSFKWQIGEELTYKVRWSFIRLGTLKLHVQDTLTINNQLVYHVRFFLDSNPLLFFVNMHNVYDSYIDEQFRTYRFYSHEKIDNILYIYEYKFNYNDSLLHIKITDVEDPTKITETEEPLIETLYDGASLIFYSRKNSKFSKQDTVLSFFEAKRGKININFTGEKKDIKIKAFKHSLPAYYIDGTVNMKGVAGLNGPFKGWFANDDRRPPLKAELKVYIGSVKVELESWKNWQTKFK